MVHDLHLSSSSSSGTWDSLQPSESSQESEAVQLSHQKGQGMSLVLQALHPLQSELAMLRSPRDPQTYDPPTAVHTNEFSTRFWTTNHGSYWHLLCKCTIRSLSQVVPRNGAPGWIEVHWSTWRSLPSESNVGSLTRGFVLLRIERFPNNDTPEVLSISLLSQLGSLDHSTYPDAGRHLLRYQSELETEPWVSTAFCHSTGWLKGPKAKCQRDMRSLGCTLRYFTQVKFTHLKSCLSWGDRS